MGQRRRWRRRWRSKKKVMKVKVRRQKELHL
jgi:hypothetical protein